MARCSTVTLSILLLLLGSSIAYYSVRSYNWLQHPHSELYAARSSKKPEDIVTPLIDASQKFDVVATVWQRTDAKLEAYRRGMGGKFGLNQEPVFSETIFRGLTLGDKYVKTSVNVSIPTAIFKSPVVGRYDLRASFVLVPTGPSPLDHPMTVSSWIPPTVKYPPVRAYEPNYWPTTAEQAIDASGTFTHLIEFHTFESGCPKTDPRPSGELAGTYDEIPIAGFFNGMFEQRASTAGLPPVHPYVITRTHLRMVGTTPIYNRTAYEKAQLFLRRRACGRNPTSFSIDEINWKNCARYFAENGHAETSVLAKQKNKRTGNEIDQLFYAPYFDASQTGWGPEDLLPAAVQREKCRTSATTSSNSTLAGPRFGAAPFGNAESMNFTWNIDFSVMSPARLRFAESAYTYHQYDMSAPLEDLRDSQAIIELFESFWGRRFGKFHPVLNPLFSTLKSGGILIAAILNVMYWHSSDSTFGISIISTVICAASWLLHGLIYITPDGKHSYAASEWAVVLSIASVTFGILPFLMLRAAYRASKSPRRVPEPSLTQQLVLFALLSVIFAFFTPQDVVLLTGDILKRAEPESQLHALNSALVLPGYFLSSAVQIYVNYKNNAIAGTDDWAAILSGIAAIAGLFKRLPALDGQSMIFTEREFTVWTAVEFLTKLVLLVQALTLPTASEFLAQDGKRPKTE